MKTSQNIRTGVLQKGDQTSNNSSKRDGDTRPPIILFSVIQLRLEGLGWGSGEHLREFGYTSPKISPLMEIGHTASENLGGTASNESSKEDWGTTTVL